MLKFTGHSRGLHIIGILSGTAILLAKMFGFLSTEEILILCIFYKSIYLQCTHSGGVNLHIFEFVLITTQKLQHFYRCLFCQQQSKKGEIVTAKFCPHVFWILLDKAVEELTMFSSINSCLGSWSTRQLVDLQGKMLKMVKLFLGAKLNHDG